MTRSDHRESREDAEYAAAARSGSRRGAPPAAGPHFRAAAAWALLFSALYLITPPGAAALEPWGPLRLFNAVVEPGERRVLSLDIGETFAGHSVSTPVIVLRGVRPGPTLCVTAGIHGDEINGVETVRRSLNVTKPEELGGTIIGVPIVNMHGFRRSTRYLPDRRDLNRHFPGLANGSSAARIAHRLFDGVIRNCNALVDFHTGSFHRRNIPQVRADLSQPSVHDLAVGFGSRTVVHTVGTPGILRRAAVEAGIPAITYEAGEPMELREKEVRLGVEGVRNLLEHKGMKKGSPRSRRGQQIYYRWHWVRANDGGIFLATVGLGDRVRAGQVLGHVTDPISNERAEVVSPFAGKVIGVAVNQVVMPGFAAFYLGVDGERPATFPFPGAEPDEALDEPFEIDERPE